MKKLMILIILNYLNIVLAQEIGVNNRNEYQISSERYITDSDGNIRMNVNVWGHIGQPGNHLVFEGIDIVTLLSMVGGPMNGARLDRIKIIREVPEENGQLIFTLNFNEFINTGDRSNFIKIKPNDTIIIPQKISSLLISSASGINTILSLITIYIQITSVL
tara:strand:+ start:1405 stop:1890 length:486 start_codon:yes stop_codon:yes gene_type:complete